jgi:Sec-independent protein translocase protein TatA
MNTIEKSFQEFLSAMNELVNEYKQDTYLQKLPMVAKEILRNIHMVRTSAQTVLNELNKIKANPSSPQECQDDIPKINAVKEALSRLSQALKQSTATSAGVSYTTGESTGAATDAATAANEPENVPGNVPGTSILRAESKYRNSQVVMSLNDSLVQLVRFKEIPALDENDVVQTICRQIMTLISTLVSDLGKLDIVRAFVGNTKTTDACKFKNTIQKLTSPESTNPFNDSSAQSRAENIAISLVSFLI